MARLLWGVVVSTVLMLPACIFQPARQNSKKSSLHCTDAGSIFASVTEDSIRDEVRAAHEAMPLSGDTAVHGQAQETEPVLSVKQARKLSKKRMLERAARQQAVLVDIPFPLNIQPIVRFFEEDSAVTPAKVVSLGYSSEKSTQELYYFYQQEMERQGWRIVASSMMGGEALACYTKPGRFCSLSVRPSALKSKRKKPMVEMVIFTGRVE